MPAVAQETQIKPITFQGVQYSEVRLPPGVADLVKLEIGNAPFSLGDIPKLTALTDTTPRQIIDACNTAGKGFKNFGVVLHESLDLYRKLSSQTIKEGEVLEFVPLVAGSNNRPQFDGGWSQRDFLQKRGLELAPLEYQVLAAAVYIFNTPPKSGLLRPEMHFSHDSRGALFGSGFANGATPNLAIGNCEWGISAVDTTSMQPASKSRFASGFIPLKPEAPILDPDKFLDVDALDTALPRRS